ncbi:MAG: MFS transporter [Rhodospirillales bacterium]
MTVTAPSITSTVHPEHHTEPLDNLSPTALLLNVGHAMDHLFLLIFATGVAAIARDFGLASWEDMMPFAVGASVAFGLGSLPSGRLGDLWGRRPMMIVFFLGLGVSGVIVSFTQTPWQMAAALALMGLFASIYHPVGIPLLVQNSLRPGFTIGLNGLAGNLGIAVAAVLTGFLVQRFGWRAAFLVPSGLSILAGIAFAMLAPRELAAPAKRKPKQSEIPASVMARIFLVMTLTAICGNLVFNFTTNGNTELIRTRLTGLADDPVLLGALLAAVYTVASFAQIVVGKLIDRVPLRRLFMSILLLQIPFFVLAALAQGWAFYVMLLGFMIFVFGAIPFIDAMVVKFVDDRLRSRVSGMRFAISFGFSASAVWLLGPLVKAAGFDTLLYVLAAIATIAVACASFLPSEQALRAPQPTPQPAPAPAE